MKKTEAAKVTLPATEGEKVNIFKLTRAANKAFKRNKRVNLTKFAAALELNA